jgi:SAM-dependent methyltransferase
MSWWSTFFDDTYAAIGLDTRPTDAVDNIIAFLGVEPGARIFDQCCGNGRLAVPLAQRGFHVVGVDQAASYIATAKSRAVGTTAEFHAGDAFEFTTEPCDGAYNWFTSFGYHRDDRVNIRMLQRAFESLRPGARLALEYISVPRVLADFRPAMVERFPDDVWLLQEPTIDFVDGMFQGSWTLLHPDGRREVRRSENRAYMPHEIVALFRTTGFTQVGVFGTDRAPFDRASRRCIVVGTRP